MGQVDGRHVQLANASDEQVANPPLHVNVAGGAQRPVGGWDDAQLRRAHLAGGHVFQHQRAHGDHPAGAGIVHNQRDVGGGGGWIAHAEGQHIGDARLQVLHHVKVAVGVDGRVGLLSRPRNELDLDADAVVARGHWYPVIQVHFADAADGARGRQRDDARVARGGQRAEGNADTEVVGARLEGHAQRNCLGGEVAHAHAQVGGLPGDERVGIDGDLILGVGWLAACRHARRAVDGMGDHVTDEDAQIRRHARHVPHYAPVVADGVGHQHPEALCHHGAGGQRAKAPVHHPTNGGDARPGAARHKERPGGHLIFQFGAQQRAGRIGGHGQCQLVLDDGVDAHRRARGWVGCLDQRDAGRGWLLHRAAAVADAEEHGIDGQVLAVGGHGGGVFGEAPQLVASLLLGDERRVVRCARFDAQHHHQRRNGSGCVVDAHLVARRRVDRVRAGESGREVGGVLPVTHPGVDAAHGIERSVPAVGPANRRAVFAEVGITTLTQPHHGFACGADVVGHGAHPRRATGPAAQRARVIGHHDQVEGGQWRGQQRGQRNQLHCEATRFEHGLPRAGSARDSTIDVGDLAADLAVVLGELEALPGLGRGLGCAPGPAEFVVDRQHVFVEDGQPEGLALG